MREVERIIAMHRHDQVLIVIRQLQRWQFLNAVPFARTEENGSARVASTDQPDRFSKNWVQDTCRRFILRLVQQLESNRVGCAPIMRSDLLPKRIELSALHFRIRRERVEMMNVHDHVQPFGERVCYQEVDLSENLWRQLELRRAGTVMMPPHRDPHMIESFLLDVDEVLSRIMHSPIL